MPLGNLKKKMRKFMEKGNWKNLKIFTKWKFISSIFARIWSHKLIALPWKFIFWSRTFFKIYNLLEEMPHYLSLLVPQYRIVLVHLFAEVFLYNLAAAPVEWELRERKVFKQFVLIRNCWLFRVEETRVLVASRFSSKSCLMM